MGRVTNKAMAVYLNRVIEVLDEMRPHWPLTLRQVYYQLVAAQVIENNVNEYKKLSRVLSQARLDGAVSWEAIEDRHRSMMKSHVWADAADYIEDEIQIAFRGYRRDLSQSQSVRLQVWVEKDALGKLCHDVAAEYYAPVIIGKGFASMTFKNACRDRVLEADAAGKATRILYFGDLDPSGWAMLPSMLETLQDDMDLGDLVEGVRCALTPAQVEEHNLPHNPEALKKTDSRARKYIEQFGLLAVELDALHPEALQSLVRESIETSLDMGLFRSEQDQEAVERFRIENLRKKVCEFAEAQL